jgi:hypothetical protein
MMTKVEILATRAYHGSTRKCGSDRCTLEGFIICEFSTAFLKEEFHPGGGSGFEGSDISERRIRTVTHKVPPGYLGYHKSQE